uniref:Uncharacterized protein n=1 Tax=Desulfovibrio sp. U5L TaxID=596152 RepID=I2PWQ3_9BACT
MTDPKAIAQAITTLYPEVSRHGVDITVADDPATGDWLVTMRREGNSLSTHLAKKNAEECLEGIQCTTLGIQIGRFIEAYCLGKGDCPV